MRVCINKNSPSSMYLLYRYRKGSKTDWLCGSVISPLPTIAAATSFSVTAG